MDHLSKQQLVLLALLVSFMTSLATGIVTVSLMDQAPQGVTRTISQVIEKTIQQAAPQDASVGTVTLSVDDQLATAVTKVSSSVVKIEDPRSNAIVGLGLVISKDGLIMADKSVVSQSYGYSNPGYSVSNYSAMLSDGTIVPISLIPISAAQSQANSDIVFLEPSSNATANSSSQTAFVPITAAPSFSLGQSVFSLAGTSTAILGQGIVTDMAATSSPANISSPINTSIPTEKVSAGSPLFDIRGDVIGIRTSPLSSSDSSAFSPIAPLMALIPVLK
jgi:hypothetical protein